jgi:hypothetical protein
VIVIQCLTAEGFCRELNAAQRVRPEPLQGGKLFRPRRALNGQNDDLRSVRQVNGLARQIRPFRTTPLRATAAMHEILETSGQRGKGLAASASGAADCARHGQGRFWAGQHAREDYNWRALAATTINVIAPATAHPSCLSS